MRVVAIAPGADGPDSSDEESKQSSSRNQVAQTLRQDLYTTTTEIATLRARLADTRNLLSESEDRARQIPEVEAQLNELTREADVNRTLYNDLVRRREMARVTMNADQEQQGLSLRIHQPAYYPYQTTGLRLIHFVMLGCIIGLSRCRRSGRTAVEHSVVSGF